MWHAYVKRIRLVENNILYRWDRALDRDRGEDKGGKSSFTNDFEAPPYLMTRASESELCEATMRAMEGRDCVANDLDILHQSYRSALTVTSEEA